MNWQGYAQIILYLIVLVALVKPLGGYMARVYEGEPVFLEKLFRPLERLVYRLCGVPDEAEKREMTWTTYAGAMLLFNVGRAPRRLRDPAPAGSPAAQPAGHERALAGSLVEHGHELRRRTRTGRTTAASRR